LHERIDDFFKRKLGGTNKRCVYLHRFRNKALAEQPADADVAQLVERNLAKVEVAGSNLVIRSNAGAAMKMAALLSF
jgi:hypothetical protein